MPQLGSIAFRISISGFPVISNKLRSYVEANYDNLYYCLMQWSPLEQMIMHADISIRNIVCYIGDRSS